MKIIKILFSSILFVFIAFVVFVLISSRTDKLGSVRSFVVLTGSMEPAIKSHALVFSKPANYQKNDVVVFQQKDKTVIHRIIEITQKNGSVLYKTKGDANNAADSDLVGEHSVLGKVSLSLPYFGSFILLLKTVPGFMILIVLPAFVFVAMELLDIKKEIEIVTEKRVLKKMQTT